MVYCIYRKPKTLELCGKNTSECYCKKHAKSCNVLFDVIDDVIGCKPLFEECDLYSLYKHVQHNVKFTDITDDQEAKKTFFTEIMKLFSKEVLLEMYSKYYPKLVIFLQKKKREWEESGAYCIIGTFIYNMIIRDYDVSVFVKMFCKDPELIKRIDEKERTKQILKSNIYIHVEQKDVAKYMTINHIKPRNLLKKTVKYQIRKNTLAIFDHEHGSYSHDKVKSLYLYHWLYYACASDIWKDRITKYNGKIDHVNRCIYFENTDNEDAFYEKYNLETDEQHAQIHIMNIGTELEEQMDWTSFYENYYCE